MLRIAEKMSPIFYGMSMIPKEFWLDYGYALLTIAGSDGEVSDPELEWLTIDLATSLEVGQETIFAWENFDFDDADLKEIFDSFNASSIADFSRLLIYDAVRMSCADDDYADEEKEKVMEAAQILGLNREAVVAIEALIEMEMATEKMRSLIL
jgi:DNA-binding XRE family transcriptional regulator